MTSISSLGTPSTVVGLTTHTRHQQRPSPVSLNFVAPPVQQNLSFKPIALAAAIARTATTWDAAPAGLLDGLQRSALIELDTLVQGGSGFALKPDFMFLADTAGSQFAAKIGAGITHLYMDALGYAWRANAVCLSSALNPHADFIYDGGNVTGHGVVLAEAHGSFAKSATATAIRSAAKRKYVNQVKDYIAKQSPFGKVIHGYSIAFGSNPTSVGSFLAVSETRISKPRKKVASTVTRQNPDSASEGTPTPIALATHRSNFLLMGARDVVNWIDWLRSSDVMVPESHRVEFIRLQYAGRNYLTSTHWFWRLGGPPWWIEDFFDNRDWWRGAWRAGLSPSQHSRTNFGWFAIDERGGVDFLNALSAAIRGRERGTPEKMGLPTFEPTGFGFSDGDRVSEGSAEEGYQYALFSDGLALLGEPFRGRPLGTIAWSPEGGMEEG